MNIPCDCNQKEKSSTTTPNRLPIELYGKYYYREANYSLVRITIVAKGERAGFYFCVEGHWTEAEIKEKDLKSFLIHQNRILQ